MEDLDIRARLKVTDESGEALHRVRAGLDDAAHSAEAAHEQMGFVEHTLANFAAIELHEVVDSVRELADSFVEAAAEGQTADQAIAALISSVQGREWGDAHKEAEQLGDELDDIAVAAHQAGPAVASAFQGLLEITGATEEGVEAATDRVADMSRLASSLGKDVGSISQEFAMMQEGIVRTKGQLFHVLNATGIFGDNIKKAGAGWAALTEDERARRLSYALEQMGGQLKDVPATYDQVKTSIGQLWDMTKEKLGEPIIHALTPELERLASIIEEEGVPAIEHFAKEMSTDVARWVHDAAEMVQHGFDYLKAHGQEIHDTIVSAVETAKSVVDFILAHKEEIAVAFGANVGLKIAGGLAKTVGESGVGSMVGRGIGALWGAGASGAAGLGTGAAGGALAVGAFGAAAGAWLLAGTQIGKLFNELEADSRQSFDAVRDGMARMASESTEWTDVETEAFARMRDNLIDASVALGEDVGAATAYAEALERAHHAHAKNMEFAEALHSMADSFEVLATSANLGVESARNAAEMAAAENEQAAFDSGQGQQIVEQFASGFEQLRAAHDQAAMDYVAGLLANSKNLSAAFLASAQMSDEGFGALADSVAKGGAQFADLAKSIRDLSKSAEHQKMTMNFSMPGAKIDLHQDFRDQDPDRVVLAMKRDIMRAAANRASSGFSIPFGV